MGFPKVPMKIRVDEIKGKLRRLSATEEATAYPVLAALQDSGECIFLEPLRTELNVAREYDHIRVEGQIETRVRLACSRCLTDYELGLAAQFTIFYIRSSGAIPAEEVELSEQDLVSLTFEGDEIDFIDEIANQVITEIPFKPLCNEECKGLCPQCGADLNAGECGCRNLEPVSKFSALKDLKIDHKGE